MNRRQFLTRATAATAVGAVLSPALSRDCRQDRPAAAHPAAQCVAERKHRRQSATRRARSACWKKHFPEAEITLWPSEIGHGARASSSSRGSRGSRSPRAASAPTASPNKPRNSAQAWDEGGPLYQWLRIRVSCRRARPWPFKKPRANLSVSSRSAPIRFRVFGREDAIPWAGTLASIRERAFEAATHASLRVTARSDRSHRVLFLPATRFSRDYLKAQGVKDADSGVRSRLTAWHAPPARRCERLRVFEGAGISRRGNSFCVIPRLRYTPYWSHAGRKSRAGRRGKKTRINQRTTKQDHDKLRENDRLLCARHGEQGHGVCRDDLPGADGEGTSSSIRSPRT